MVAPDAGTGERPDFTDAAEKEIYDFCTELYDTRRVSDATFAKIEARHGRVGAVELGGLLGHYNLIAITLLFVTGGHQLMVRGFAVSYTAVPLDASLSLETVAHVATAGAGDMFVAALQLAGPMVAVLFCAEVALGLLNRVAPAMNVIMLSFPFRILLTLSLGAVAVAMLPRTVEILVDAALRAMLTAVGR